MNKSIVILQGHPDGLHDHLCHALARAYEEGARSAGHEVHQVKIADLDFPLLRSAQDWQRGREGTPETLRPAQALCRSADHYVIVYPLWLGMMPAMLKAFLEQVFRPGVALAAPSEEKGFPTPLLKGRSARVVVTMGMPALAYRVFYGAHSLKALERNILSFAGIGPIRTTLLGMVEQAGEAKVARWCAKLAALGAKAR